MPLDVLGRTRATLTKATSYYILWVLETKFIKLPESKGLGNLWSFGRDGDRSL